MYKKFLLYSDSSKKYLKFLDIFNVLYTFNVVKSVSKFGRIFFNIQEIINLKIFTNPFLISSLIVTNLENKKSKVSFRKLFKLVEGRFSNLKKFKPLSFKIRCTGRNTKVKSLRTRFFSTRSGAPPFSCLSRSIKYVSSVANTRFGITNVEVWVYKLIKKKMFTLLSPRKIKFKKVQKVNFRGLNFLNNSFNCSIFSIKSLNYGTITAKQIENIRLYFVRKLKKNGIFYNKIFPNFGKTQKPLETRMGKGCGSIDHWIAYVKPGSLIFEVGGNINTLQISKIFTYIKNKLPIRLKINKKKLLEINI
eukprot:JP446136.1.p1 GENE.JP446136.1~~JP446136.1.p1  ORF type:complete len:306 (-),score=-80.36 JP446136.1:69-986(-)